MAWRQLANSERSYECESRPWAPPQIERSTQPPSMMTKQMKQLKQMKQTMVLELALVAMRQQSALTTTSLLQMEQKHLPPSE